MKPELARDDVEAGKVVRALVDRRLAQNVSVERLARQLGVPTDTLRAWEEQRLDLRIGSVCRWAHALGTSVALSGPPVDPSAPSPRLRHLDGEPVAPDWNVPALVHGVMRSEVAAAMLRQRDGNTVASRGNKLGLPTCELGALLGSLRVGDRPQISTLVIDVDELHPADRQHMRPCVLAAHSACVAVIIVASRVGNVEEPTRMLCGSLVEAAPEMVVVEHYESGITSWVLD